mgnify:CR=1 FL=1
MNIMELGALGELVGSIGVLATLIYLAIQMRQNTMAVRLNTAHAVTGELQEMCGLLASNQELAKIVNEAGKNAELSGVSRLSYYGFTHNLIRVYENTFLQKGGNAVSEAHWMGMTRMMIDYTAMPAFAAYWADRKHWVSAECQAYMDAEILPIPDTVGINVPGN